jgi:hypothetical protein
MPHVYPRYTGILPFLGKGVRQKENRIQTEGQDQNLVSASTARILSAETTSIVSAESIGGILGKTRAISGKKSQDDTARRAFEGDT